MCIEKRGMNLNEPSSGCSLPWHHSLSGPTWLRQPWDSYLLIYSLWKFLVYFAFRSRFYLWQPEISLTVSNVESLCLPVDSEPQGKNSTSVYACCCPVYWSCISLLSLILQILLSSNLYIIAALSGRHWCLPPVLVSDHLLHTHMLFTEHSTHVLSLVIDYSRPKRSSAIVYTFSYS